MKMFKGAMSLVLALVMSFMFSCPVFAEVTLDDLLQRIEALERENSALKSEVQAMKEKQTAQENRIASIPSTAVVAHAAPQGNLLKTKPEVELYGFIKADAVFSNHDMGNSGLAQVNATRPTAAGADDSEAHLSAQDTRLGLNFKAPDLDNGGKLTGKFEMDFSGSVAGGNYQPRLRLAYANMDFDRWAVNAGQNWDIFAPLNPSTINPGILYREGNLGTRHPQFHLVNKWGSVAGGKVNTKIGVIDTEDTVQEDSGLPVAAAYTSYEKEILGVLSTFGVGGMYGRVNLPGPTVTNSDMYAVTVGMTLKFTDWLAFKAEGFAGTNLRTLQGGPATGVAASGTSTAKTIPVKGGFVELTYSPVKQVETNIGFGLDDVDEDLAGYTAQNRQDVWDTNLTYYANLKYSLSKDLLLGLEYQVFETVWVDHEEANDQRVETSVIYKF